VFSERVSELKRTVAEQQSSYIDELTELSQEVQVYKKKQIIKHKKTYKNSS